MKVQSPLPHQTRAQQTRVKKYQIHVEEGKEEKSEALSRILDLMAESIELRRDSTAITEQESKSESIADQEAAETDETDQI